MPKHLFWALLTVAGLSVAGPWGAIGPMPARAEDAPPLRVLLVAGGCCHDYAAQTQLLKEGLEERARVQVTIALEGGSATDSKIPLYEKADWAAGYDLVIHDECFADVKDTAWCERVLAPHRAGLPAVVLHCAMHSYRNGTDNWFEFCGVTSRQHGAGYGHEVLNGDAEHPIMRPLGAGWFQPQGELYWIEKTWPTAHPLASAKNRERGTEEVCVWTNQYHDARVFGTTLGHHNETVGSHEYLDLVTRGALWARGKLNADYLKQDAAKPRILENLAFGKPATASTVEGGHAPGDAIDGDSNSRWCASGPSAPQWWQVDLGAAKHVTGCQLTWESTSGVYEYKVEGSTDGKTWNTLADQSHNAKSGSPKLAFDANVRYVRVDFLGAGPGAGWASLREVNVLGDTMVEATKATAPPSKAETIARSLHAPEGYDMTVFATPPAVQYPVYVAAAPDGVVYVSVDRNGSLGREKNYGAVYRLRDIDGDGRADESKLFVPNVDSPRGLVWDRDRLYLMHPPHLSAFLDHDGDGRADEERVLVKNIAFGFKDRPADHTSNGVTLGVDGWLYLAIGDFGFMEAEGADGRKLQLRGGGVARVRPDGSGLEIYSLGTRNILEVAVDPLLNGFTRDNTNDGGGWDIRLHHFTGIENHGYPRLFKNFGDEIIQPLADYGGGSGCGAMYLDEPGFPKDASPAAYTADWGRDFAYRHRFEPQGATFKADQTEFLRLPRITDLDVDARGHVYASSWLGAVFSYNGEDVGYLVRVTPKNHTAAPLVDTAKASEAALVAELSSASGRRRLAAQRELLARKLAPATIAEIEKLAGDRSAALASRVLAVFTLKQALGSASHARLAALADDAALRPLVIRALADRWDQRDDVPEALLVAGLSDSARALGSSRSWRWPGWARSNMPRR